MLTNNCCPTCKMPLENVDVLNTEWHEGRSYDYVYGECPNCNKQWRWTEVYALATTIDIEESELEDKAP